MEISLPRAALRRLVADAGVKFSSALCDQEVCELRSFLHRVLVVADRANKCAKRKTVARAQIEHALAVCSCPAPQNVAKLSNAELRRLQRCNLKAHPSIRKQSALSVEIPESTFKRFFNDIAVQAGYSSLRVSAAARRVLHVVSELRIIDRLQSGLQIAATTRREVSPTSIERVMMMEGASFEEAIRASELFDRLCLSLDRLLSIGKQMTVKVDHVLAALDSERSSSLLVAHNENDNNGVSKTFIVAIDRAMRGNLPDRRFQAGATALLARSLKCACRVNGNIR